MGRRRRRQLVAGGVLLGLSLLTFGLGGPLSSVSDSAYGTVGVVSFGLFLAALWIFLTVIAEREDPPEGSPAASPAASRSPRYWPFQRRQPPVSPLEIVASDTDWNPGIWRPRMIPALRRVDVEGALELLLSHDRGEGAIGAEKEIVVALSTQDLLAMSGALHAFGLYSLTYGSPGDPGFSHAEAFAWSRRAARAARDESPARPGPAETRAVAARRIGWTAWALEQGDPGTSDGTAPDPWFVVPIDQLEDVAYAVRAAADGVTVERVDRDVAAELAARLRDIVHDAHESDPAPTAETSRLSR